MIKIHRPKIGDYVLVAEYSDKNTNDPWRISFITEILETEKRILCCVEGSTRWWKHFWKITKKEGKEYLRINKGA